MWVRWTLPGFRYDQLMRMGWKMMLPLAMLNLLVTGLLLLAQRGEPMRVVPRPGVKGLRRIYVIQVLQGLLVTLNHVARNLLHPDKLPVVYYPEERKHLPPTMRGRHRLMKREDGAPRCTACMLCVTACPAECIHILAAPVPDQEIEKYPEKFDIDMLRCVFCGFCVDACPLDAIRMGVPEVRPHGLHPGEPGLPQGISFEPPQ